MIDENKEVSYFVAEIAQEIQVVDDGTYDDEDDEEDENSDAQYSL